MKRVTLAASIVGLLLMTGGLARGQNASGTLTVSATVEGSIALTFETVTGTGFALVGEGTNAATINFGTVSAYGGTVPAGVQKVIDPSSPPMFFELSTDFGIRIDKANTNSPCATVSASLATADPVNTWKVGDSAATFTLSTISQILSDCDPYAEMKPRKGALVIPLSSNSGLISQVINFMVTANPAGTGP